MQHLLMYSRENCPLCDEMREQLTAFTNSYDCDLSVVDIAADDSLSARFSLRIPVLFVDGSELCFGKLDADLLEQALTRG